MKEGEAAPALKPATDGKAKLHAALRWALLVTGVGLLVLAARGEYWFDEAWTIEGSTRGTALLEIFTAKHDNNHILNTIWIWLIGPNRDHGLYRLLSVISGAGALLVLDRIAARRGDLERLITLLLAAASYPLILYFSEARGYGPALFCAVLALWALMRWQKSPTTTNAALFWPPVILGTLAHSSFLTVYLALGLYSLAATGIISADNRDRAKHYAKLHGPALLFTAWWYWYFVMDMTVGGGNRSTIADAVPEYLVIFFGLPDEKWARILAFWPWLCACAWSLRHWYFKKRSEWLLYPLALVLAPAIAMLGSRDEYVYWRYFVLLTPYATLMIAGLMAKVIRKGKPALTALTIAAALAMIVGHAARTGPLLEAGRSRYGDVVRDMIAKADVLPATVSGDNDLQHGIMTSHAAARAGIEGKVRYIDIHRAAKGETPQFYLRKTPGKVELKDKIVYLPAAGFYVYLGSYPHYGGSSGWNVHLFGKK